MTSEGGSFGRLGVHVGTDWHVDCHTYTDRTPILSIGSGPVAVCYSTAARQADMAAVEFARALVQAAQLFAAEVERLHAEHDATGDGDCKAADGDAA